MSRTRCNGTIDDVTVANVLELVGRMRRESFSRNRNFEAFAEAGNARRLWRYLRSLEQHLLALGPRIGAGGDVRVEPRTDGGRRIIIELPEVRVRRVAMLSSDEYALLREHPEARAILEFAEAADAADVDEDASPKT